MAVVTAEQRANPALAGWVASKDKENAAAKPVTQEQTAYNAAANQFTAQNWGPTGTANGKTESQNLAAVIQQPGNTTTTTATPYIAANGQTDYHISGQPTNGNTGVAGGVVNPPPQGLGAAATTEPSGMVKAMQAMPTYVPPASSGLNFDQATNQVKGQLDPMFQRALEALKAQQHQDQLNGDELGMARGGAHSGLAADLQNKVNIGAAGKAADLDATRQTQIAQMAQDLVNRGQDNDFRNQQQKLAEYLGLNQLNLQSQNQNYNQGFQDKQFNYNSGQDSIKNGQNQQVIDYNQDPSNPNNYGQSLTNQLNELKIGNYSTEQKQQAQLFEQELKSGKMSNEAAAYNLKELTDPNSATNQSKKLDLQIKALEAKNLPEKLRLELQGLKKSNDQIGVVHYKPQTQAEKDVDQLQIRKLTAEVTKLENPTDKPAPAPKSTDYKLNPKFSEDIAYIKANPAAASMLDTEAQKFIDAYGYDGYKEMRSAAGLD